MERENEASMSDHLGRTTGQRGQLIPRVLVRRSKPMTHTQPRQSAPSPTLEASSNERHTARTTEIGVSSMQIA